MSAWFRRCFASVVLILSSAIAAPAAFAQTSYTFNLPEQSLADSLRAIGQQTDMNILFEPDAVKNARSPALRGQYTVDEAIRLVLVGTKLEAQHTAASNVVIKLKSARSSVLPATTADPPGNSGTRLAQTSSGQSASSAGPQNTGTSSSASGTSKTEGLEEITVTGTHIHDAAPITPVMTITHDQIVAQGYSTLSEVVEQLPQNFKAGVSVQSNPLNGMGNGASNNFSYASGINLRGLGGNSTLVLLNGQRLAPTALGGFVDISQIPVSAIERIEILPDGASAVYGSDAVAGVVNIITRRTFDGVEVGGRVTGISDGRSPNYGGNLIGGISWAGGSAVLGLDHEEDKPLYARNRPFAGTFSDQLELSPKDTRTSYYLSLQQAFTDTITWSLDSLGAHRDTHIFGQSVPGITFSDSIEVSQASIASQLDYRFSPDWIATLAVQGSREKDVDNTYETYGVIDGFDPISTQTHSIEPRLDGKLFDWSAGAVRAAIGAQFRGEDFRLNNHNASAAGQPSLVTQDIRLSRRVKSVYAEFLVPLVGAENAVTGIQSLRANISGRYDDYSDVGHTSNPKFGIEWIPLSGLSVHASYSRSFQAPTLFELSPAIEVGYIYQAANPTAPSGTSNFVTIDGTNPNLQPETAKNYNAGVTFEPLAISGLKLDLSYFSIDFTNQINRLIEKGFSPFGGLTDAAVLGNLVQLNPSASEVQHIITDPNRLVYNFIGGFCRYGTAGCPTVDPSTIAALTNIGYVNAASVNIHGLDLNGKYSGQMTQYGRFHADADATFFTSYRQQIIPSAAWFSPVNTLVNPLKFRAKTNVGWDWQGFGVNTRLNYAPSYYNTSFLGEDCPGTGNCRISSWTTVDMSLSYATPASTSSLWGGFRISLDVTNVFNREPPFVATPVGLGYTHYDPTNANPFLRSFAVTFSKRFGKAGPG